MALRIPLLPTPLRWLPATVVAGLIWYWSLVAAPPAGIASAAKVVDGDPISVTSALDPAAFALGHELSALDGRHLVAYASLTLTLAYGLVDRNLPVASKAALVFTVAVGFGVCVEAGQSFHPARTASALDAFSNAVGAAIALSWYRLERRATVVPILHR